MKSAFSLVVVWALAVPAWALQSRYDPSPKRPAQQRPNLVDFALNQINPTNTDYGCRIDQARKTILDDTLKEYNWWASVIASVFVVLSAFVILHQHQDGRRRERIAARFISQAQNSLVDAQRQLQSMTARHDELIESLKRSAESTLPARTATRSNEAPGNSAGKADSAQRDHSSGRPVPERGVMYAAQISALNKKILTLQQDVDAGRKREDAARDRERNLQREIDRMRRQVPNDQAGAAALGG